MTREKELFQKAKMRDRDAWNELIIMYYPDILRYCLWHTPNRSTAEDAVQETFLKAIRYSEEYMHREKFKAYLYKIASNTCIDFYRKKSQSDVAIEEIQEEFSYVENGFLESEADIQLCSMVEGLTEDLREVVLLRYGQDLSLRETAEVLNLPLRTVQSRVRRALKKIRENLKEGMM